VYEQGQCGVLSSDTTVLANAYLQLTNFLGHSCKSTPTTFTAYKMGTCISSLVGSAMYVAQLNGGAAALLRYIYTDSACTAYASQTTITTNLAGCSSNTTYVGNEPKITYQNAQFNLTFTLPPALGGGWLVRAYYPTAYACQNGGAPTYVYATPVGSKGCPATSACEASVNVGRGLFLTTKCLGIPNSAGARARGALGGSRWVGVWAAVWACVAVWWWR